MVFHDNLTRNDWVSLIHDQLFQARTRPSQDSYVHWLGCLAITGLRQCAVGVVGG